MNLKGLVYVHSNALLQASFLSDIEVLIVSGFVPAEFNFQNFPNCTVSWGIIPL